MKDTTRRNILVVLLLLGGMLLLALILGIVFLLTAFKTYKNPQEGFAIKYPLVWDVKEAFAPGVIVGFYSPNTDRFQKVRDGLSITRTNLIGTGFSTLDDYVGALKAQSVFLCGDYMLREDVPVKLGNHQGRKLVLDASRETVPLIVVYYTFVYDQVAYTITYTGVPAHYKVDRFVVDYIVSTLRVLF